MTTLLTKVRVSMSIHAHRRTRGLLEGEYGSIHKGRSLDFDDLREYVPGDDVKDLDWKATARSPRPLVKRYVAVRKHTVMLVVSTGRGMAAMAGPESTKRELAILSAGTIGYIAVRHGDLVSLVVGDESGAKYVRPGGSTAHLEQLLQTLDRRIGLDRPSGDLAATLRYVVRNIKQRTILVLVTDGPDLGDDDLDLLRRLVAQHEVIHLGVDDLAATEPAIARDGVYDVDTAGTVPRFYRRDARLRLEVDAARDEASRRSARGLARLGIASEHVAREPDVVPAIFRLLERHRRARV